jgi:hypothetical protein
MKQFDAGRLTSHMDLNTTKTQVIERRSKARMKCTYPAMIRGCTSDGKKFEENGTVLNLSASGAYVLINHMIEVGQELSVKIALPTGSLEWGSSKLATSGVVVRTEYLSEEVLGIAILFQHYRFL